METPLLGVKGQASSSSLNTSPAGALRVLIDKMGEALALYIPSQEITATTQDKYYLHSFLEEGNEVQRRQVIFFQSYTTYIWQS